MNKSRVKHSSISVRVLCNRCRTKFRAIDSSVGLTPFTDAVRGCTTCQGTYREPLPFTEVLDSDADSM